MGNALSALKNKALMAMGYPFAVLLICTKSPRLLSVCIPPSHAGYYYARFCFAFMNRVVDWLVKLNETNLAIQLFYELVLRYSKRANSSFAGIEPALNKKIHISTVKKRDGFNKFYALLEEHHLSPFLCFGLLLGYVREGRFMEHDMDFDLGFMYEEGLSERIKCILETAGYRIEFFEPSPWPTRIVAVQRETGLLFDLVFFKEEKEHFLTYAQYLHHLIIRRRKKFRIIQVEFEGRKVLIPENPELFLEENYGNWRVKSSYHHYILTSRLTDLTQTFLQPLLLAAITRNIYQNNDPAIRSLIEKWNKARPDLPISYNDLQKNAGLSRKGTTLSSS